MSAHRQSRWFTKMNYPAVHGLRLLNAEIQNPKQILANGLAYPKGHARYLTVHWIRPTGADGTILYYGEG